LHFVDQFVSIGGKSDVTIGPTVNRQISHRDSDAAQHESGGDHAPRDLHSRSGFMAPREIAISPRLLNPNWRCGMRSLSRFLGHECLN
jgi:hypothetical protein